MVAGGADSVENDRHLLTDDLVVTATTIQTSQDGCSIVAEVFGEEPTRGLGQGQHHDDDNDGEDALEGNGESPSEVIRSIEAAIVDPVGNQSTNGDVATLNANELTTALGLAAPDA